MQPRKTNSNAVMASYARPEEIRGDRQCPTWVLIGYFTLLCVTLLYVALRYSTLFYFSDSLEDDEGEDGEDEAEHRQTHADDGDDVEGDHVALREIRRLDVLHTE